MIKQAARLQRQRTRAVVATAILAAVPAFAAGAGQQGTDPAERVARGTSVQENRPPARLAVSPGKIEVVLGSRPIVQAMRLLNLSDRPVPVKVSVAPWELDERNQVRVLEPTEQSMDQWMVFNPRSFTIPARSEQTVRFSIRPRVRPRDGEHRAMVYFEEQQPEEGPRTQVLFKLGVAVYAYAGSVARSGAINSIDVAADPQFLSAAIDISSTGNAHIRLDGQYAVWPLGTFPGVSSVALMPDVQKPGFEAPEPILAAGLLPTLPILAGTRRQLVLSGAHALPAGRYMLAVVGTLAGEAFRDAIEFTVPAPIKGQIAGDQQQQ